MFGYFSSHTLLNINKKTDNVSLVSHLNVGFHKALKEPIQHKTLKSLLG